MSIATQKPEKRLFRLELSRCMDCPHYKDSPASVASDGYCQWKYSFRFTITNKNIIDERCQLDILHPERSDTMDEMRERQMWESSQYMVFCEE